MARMPRALLACMLSVSALASCPEMTWIDASGLTLVNQYFPNLSYTRLPTAAKPQVRPSIWSLAQSSAGLAISFESSASEIWVDYNLTSASLGMVHMSPTGVSGADLWGLDPRSKEWRWVGTTAPSSARVCQKMVHLQPVGTPGAVYPTKWLLYLPLYNGVSNVSIGVPPGSTVSACPGDCELGLLQKPVVWYGSSITQGACASKPGDAYTNAIARALQRPVANFGFSGNCLYEPEVMKFLLEIDAAVYVVDCNPNSEVHGYDYVHTRAVSLVQSMFAARPNTTIILASGTKEGAVWLEGSTTLHSNGTAALKQAYNELLPQLPSGGRLQFVVGDEIYKQPDEAVFWEMTVMGTHPSSLGMERFTAFWAPLLKQVLDTNRTLI